MFTVHHILYIILYLLLYLYQHCKATVLISINLEITVNFENSSYRVLEHGESIAPLLILTESSPCPFIVRAQLISLGELIDTHMHIWLCGIKLILKIMYVYHYLWLSLQQWTMWVQITPSYVFANILSSECNISFYEFWDNLH